jgi:hypothetical protein
MSDINTNKINVTYPVPGVNNSTQGFRDNFTSIKTNLDTASQEITELQQKAIFKAALTGSSINNDMNGTLISNASVKSFRATTYNLGNDISGIQTIDVTKADVQYGSITGNTTLQFGGWSPSGTQSNVQLLLTVANSNAYITFPNTVCKSDGNINTGMKFSTRFLENYTSNGNPSSSVTYTNKVTAPKDVDTLHYVFSTENCGSTIEVTPINRTQKANQIPIRTPSSTGEIGDTQGTICADSTKLYICTGNYDGTTVIWKKITLSSI